MQNFSQNMLSRSLKKLKIKSQYFDCKKLHTNTFIEKLLEFLVCFKRKLYTSKTRNCELKSEIPAIKSQS